MKAQEFAWFLHGYFQVQNPVSIDARQTRIIRAYLQTMFSETPQSAESEDATTKKVGDAAAGVSKKDWGKYFDK